MKITIPPISQKLVDDAGRPDMIWYDKLKLIEQLQPLSDIVTPPAKSLSVVIQKFTASGTYTPTAGMVFCIIEDVGSGGGGAGCVGFTPGTVQGGGGGGGSYARLVASAATIGASKTVTVGNAGTGGAAGGNNGAAGSDVSVGSLCIGKGGSGGVFGTSGSTPARGAGGVAGTGDLTIPGGAGGAGWRITAGAFLSVGDGGDSYFGHGAQPPLAASGAVQNGTAGTGFGAGGAGGSANNVAGSAAGGDGSKGIAVITEFIFA